jgi:hypothetical protein
MGRTDFATSIGFPDYDAMLVQVRAELAGFTIVIPTNVFSSKTLLTIQEIIEKGYSLNVFNTSREPEAEKMSWFRTHSLKFFVNSSGKHAEMSNLSMPAKVLKVSGVLKK